MSALQLTPFHLAFPVTDLAETRAFYLDILGCEAGRSAETWTDFNLFGHQMSAHLAEQMPDPGTRGYVGEHIVPIPHFGVVLTMPQWKEVAKRLESYPRTDWVIRPTVRFVGEPGEQATLFIRDPSGNALEFKGFAQLEAVFAT